MTPNDLERFPDEWHPCGSGKSRDCFETLCTIGAPPESDAIGLERQPFEPLMPTGVLGEPRKSLKFLEFWEIFVRDLYEDSEIAAFSVTPAFSETVTVFPKTNVEFMPSASTQLQSRLGCLWSKQRCDLGRCDSPHRTPQTLQAVAAYYVDDLICNEFAPLRQFFAV